MNIDRGPSPLAQAGVGIGITLIFFAAVFTSAPGLAKDWLPVGKSTGTYTPAFLGDSVIAHFTVERTEGETPSWKASMSLELDPPDNGSVSMDAIRGNEDELTFTLHMRDGPQHCVLTEQNGKLEGPCFLEADAEKTEIATLVMDMAPPDVSAEGPANAAGTPVDTQAPAAQDPAIAGEAGDMVQPRSAPDTPMTGSISGGEGAPARQDPQTLTIKQDQPASDE